MKTPRLEIYLQDDRLCIAKVDDGNLGARLIVDIEMDELKSLNPTDATYRVGGTVLNVLRLWHEKEFGEWSVPPIFKSPSQ